jgi:hypothetical protein
MFQATGTHRDDGGINNVTGSINNLLSKMEQTLKLWQAVIGTIGVLITVVTIMINQSNKIETQRLRIEFLETSSRDQGLQIKDLNQQINVKYENMNGKLTDILVALQNKENKK